MEGAHERDKQQEQQANRLWKEVIGTPMSKGNTDRGTKSWAYLVDEEQEVPEGKNLVWDNFDITKVSNAGFKLEYVPPSKHGEANIVEIEPDDIKSEVEY